jgi:hypothetical protein
MSTYDISQQLAEEQLIRAYFLGDLPESEEERVQERLFTDPAFFESLLIVEGELVDDYALDLISDRERTKLESGFLTSPHQYRKVEFVRTLDRYIANNKALASAHGSTVPSLFARLRSIFRKSALPVFQTVESAGYQSNEKEGEVKEQVLREAEANRRLLQSLMVNDWLGLEVLFQLTSASQVAQTDLAALVERDDAAVTSTISRLIDSGLVEEAAGKYTCSSFGSELLERVKDVTDHD